MSTPNVLVPRSIAARVNVRFANYAPKGWWSLLQEMDVRLSAVDPEYRLDQVKQKWGLLTVYLANERYADRHPVLQALQSIIDEYERKSSAVCEECGAAGERHGDRPGGGSIRTLCRDCAAVSGFRPEWGDHIARLQRMGQGRGK